MLSSIYVILSAILFKMIPTAGGYARMHASVSAFLQLSICTLSSSSATVEFITRQLYVQIGPSLHLRGDARKEAENP